MCVRRIIVAMVALGAAAALVAPAAGRGVGTPVQVRDRDDTAGPLDIATASVRLRERPGRGRMLVLRLGTHEQWDAEALAEQGGSAASFIAFEFDGDRRQPADRCVEVTLGAAGELAARMKAPCTPIHARPVGDSLSVRRRGPRAIELAVPLGSLRQSALRRGWRATSSFEALGPECAPFANAAPEGRFGACADITRWAGLDRAARRTRRRRACTTKGAKTIKATRHARAFKTGARVYGCLYSAGRRFLLANPAYGVDQVRNVRLAGRFVGYSRQAQGQRQVTVRELRRGRIVHNATAAVAPRCCFNFGHRPGAQAKRLGRVDRRDHSI